MTTPDAIHEFLAITPALASGGQPTQAQLPLLAAAGFQAVINLGLSRPAAYALADEAALLGALGLDYIHIPVLFDRPTVEDLATFFQAMARFRGRKLFVHCAANKRATAFLGLYRALVEGLSAEEAFAPMAEIWEPDAVWTAFIARSLASAV